MTRSAGRLVRPDDRGHPDGCGHAADLDFTLLDRSEISRLVEGIRRSQDLAAAGQRRDPGRDVDAASRVAIEGASLGEKYGHGLGHGVGLEIHEEPSLRPESDSVLEVGNVVTVEPGIYLAGDVGVRIEDMVVVTEDGCERLTAVTKEPVVVG